MAKGYIPVTSASQNYRDVIKVVTVAGIYVDGIHRYLSQQFDKEVEIARPIGQLGINGLHSLKMFESKSDVRS